MLAVLETQPVQYHAPVYRAIQEKFSIPVTAIYGSDFSISGYRDADFGETFAWDTDLLSGYSSIFLSRVATGGAKCFEDVSPSGLADALRKIKPKAVLLTGYRTRFNHVGLLTARRMGVPVLFRAETTDHALQRSAVKSFVRDSSLRFYYRLANKLLYIGQHSLHHYERLGAKNGKLVFSPYCVDTEHFKWDDRSREILRPNARAAMNLRDDQILVLFAGKLSTRKRPDLILDAIKLMPPEVRDKLVVGFLGSGELSEHLELLANTEPKVRVLFLGFQNQSKLSPYYQSADVLVLPSQESETWGLVVNEAMQHGIPCIVSDGVGCAPDLIEDGVTGYVFENGSASSLAANLQKIFNIAGSVHVRTNCRNKVRDYSVINAAHGIAEAYRSVVQS